MESVKFSPLTQVTAACRACDGRHFYQRTFTLRFDIREAIHQGITPIPGLLFSRRRVEIQSTLGKVGKYQNAVAKIVDVSDLSLVGTKFHLRHPILIM